MPRPRATVGKTVLESEGFGRRMPPMPPLAIVVCPLPAGTAAAVLSQQLPHLLTGDGVRIFCPEPHQAPAAWQRAAPVLPLADLPAERAAGRISAPVYLLDGGPAEAALARYRREVPGATLEAALQPDPRRMRMAAAAVRGPAVQPRTTGPTVEAMVLAYKSKGYIAPCLDSLLAQDWPGLKITVLDNASGDGTADYVREHYPSIEVLEAPRNLGFAAGHNVLFERSTADHVALLNHDAVARRNWVSELVAAAEALPDGAVFGSKMLMRRCPTILNSTGIVMNESGFAADRHIGLPDRDPNPRPTPVFAVCGGAMLIRGSVLRRLGGFDPTFFMYVEDVDLCWRARLAGHQIYYVPTSTVVHDWHGDLAAAAGAGKTPSADDAAIAEREGRRRFMVERNRLQAVIKNYDWPNLRRVWQGLRDHDRGRRQALSDHIANGGGALPRQVLAAITTARSWCRRHVPGLFWRRLRAQRFRRVPDAAVTGLIVPGFHEPAGVGDLHAIVDRHCAVARPEIVMALADQGSLGPGWHQAEPGQAGRGGQRWSMAECWFYLARPDGIGTVTVHAHPRPRDGWAELWIDGIALPRQPITQGKPIALTWQLPQAIPAGTTAECRLLCRAFVPLQEGMGQDNRELGLSVTRIAGA